MKGKPTPEIIAVEREIARIGRIGGLYSKIARDTETLRYIVQDIRDAKRRLKEAQE